MLRKLVAKILRKNIDTSGPTLPPGPYDDPNSGCAVVLIATTAMAYFLMF